MRPITLTISAFGPYAGETTLNFDALGTQRLFVITGPTGSGKTTVFEAMLYALYGKLSKRGMDPQSLRCDFLNPGDDRVTFVDFTFDIGGKAYRIRRQPKQRVAKKRGDGLREVGQEATLSCVGHEAFLPLTKIGEVDAKIVELVGLDEEQFKKIVMLPQGAFQEFLISNTKDKMALLRNIFNTGLYDQVLQRLKTRVSEVIGQYERLKTEYQTKAQMLQFDGEVALGEQPSAETMAQLAVLNQDENDKLPQLEKTLNDAGDAYRKAVEHFKQEEQHNDTVEKWQKAEQRRGQLAAKAAEMDNVRGRIAALDAARDVVPSEDRANEEVQKCQNQKVKVETLAHNVSEAERALAAAELRNEQADNAWQNAQKAYQTLPALSEKRTHMKQYVSDLEAWRLKNAEATKAAQAYENAETAFAAARKNEAALLTQREEKQRLENEKNESATKKLQLEAQDLKNRVEYRAVKHYMDLLEERPALVQALDKAQSAFCEAQAALQRVQTQNRQQLAATLAKDLAEGTPCPVCGAVHHPSLAQFAQGYMDEKNFEEAHDEARNQLSAAQAALAQKEELIAKELKALAEYGIDDEASARAYLTTLSSKGAANKAALDEEKEKVLQYEKQLAALGDVEKNYEENQKAIEKARSKCDGYLAEKNKLEAKAETYRGNVEALAAAHGFTEDVDVAALEAEIAAIENRYTEAKAFYEDAMDAAAKAHLDKANADSKLENGKELLEELIQSAAERQAAFEKAREAYFADAAAYQRAKADMPRRAQLQKNIDEYTKECSDNAATCRLLAEQLGDDREIHDITLAETAKERAEKERQSASEALSAQKNRCDQNNTLLSDIQLLYDTFCELESRFAVLGKLRDVLDGKNALNMRFETFAQAYYFERMLLGANERLARMSHGRYSFKRKETVRDGRRQAGLDLDVMDAYTGRARDVSTLSGGESFKASLSLALGLADVVASESGGVELSTIFIDEGFGTVDEESLDDTVETLISLQDSGRLVGVISHVAELKERIPAHLVVTSGSEGSTARFEVRE